LRHLLSSFQPLQPSQLNTPPSLLPSMPHNCSLDAEVTPLILLSCRYVAVKALQSGSFPRILISGGYGHSTAHLYSSVSKHPLWHPISTAEGRCKPASC
jgi:hypothetical protein